MSNQTKETNLIDQEWLNQQIKNFHLDDYLIQLNNKNKVFYALVAIPTIYFTKSLPTLGVYLDKNTNQIVMAINPEYFFCKTQEERIFSLCHESMHILLNHIYLDIDKENHDLKNIAQDIVINENLLHDYYWKLSEMKSFLKEGCFVETIFTSQQIIENKIIKNGGWEYYFDLIKKLRPDLKKIKICLHNLTGPNGKMVPLTDDILDDLLKDVIDKLTKQELEQLKKQIKDTYNQSGNQSLGQLISIINKKLARRVDWKTILKRSIKSVVERKEIDKYNFHKISRRNVLLENDKLLIPSINKGYSNKIEKHNILIALDCSGSCLEFSDKFFQFAKSLPEDICNIKICSFDTEVYEIDRKRDSLLGGGGTSFSCVETYIRRQREKFDVIIMVTDGDGDKIDPIDAKKWIWFLDGSKNKTLIPLQSKIYELDVVY